MANISELTTHSAKRCERSGTARRLWIRNGPARRHHWKAWSDIAQHATSLSLFCPKTATNVFASWSDVGGSTSLALGAPCDTRMWLPVVPDSLSSLRPRPRSSFRKQGLPNPSKSRSPGVLSCRSGCSLPRNIWFARAKRGILISLSSTHRHVAQS